MALELLYLALTFLFAAVPFGLLVTMLAGGAEDIRAVGSGNIGTTNVARAYGWRIAAIVLLLDMFKGWLPVMLCGVVHDGTDVLWQMLVVAAAFLGHCFPIFLAFHGGKGVATGGGAMFALAPLPTLGAIVTWGLTLAVTGRSSVASLAAVSVLFPILLWWDTDTAVIALMLGMGIVLTHRANIGRIVRGAEEPVVKPVWGRAPEPSPADLLNAPVAGVDHTHDHATREEAPPTLPPDSLDATTPDEPPPGAS